MKALNGQARLGLILFAWCVTSACGNQGSATRTSAQSTRSSVRAEGNAPPMVTGSGTSSSSSSSGGTPLNTNPTLKFTVTGLGNHAKHICVPATNRLYLRVKPNATSSPLRPVNTTIKYPDGTIVYDGSPAVYSKLRVRLSIPGTTAAWDYLADVGSNSVIGNYSDFLRNVPESTVPATTSRPVPDYTTMWILGSDAYDGLCTFWEQKLGKCPTVSSELRFSEMVACPVGQQKILVSSIVSDFPCTNDKINWCQGGTVQTVTDYQSWSVTIEASTENTAFF